VLFLVSLLAGAAAVPFVQAFGAAFEVCSCGAVGTFWRGS
jgi:hypothetical protein